MLERLWNLWRPENFHFHHRLDSCGGYFEGWYFKLVDQHGHQPYAIIPGIFLGPDRHAFVQVLDGRAGTAAYHRFDVADFQADRQRFEISIAGNRFCAEGLSLDIDAGRGAAGQAISGEVRLGHWTPWPVGLISPGVMGPYSFVPFMECNHGVLSLDHPVSGRLVVDDRETDYDGGRGYVEKDWGRRFPSGYVWAQSNHFDRPGISVTASVAIIPWLRGWFRGYLVGLLLDGELHRFTTHDGATLEKLAMSDTHLQLAIRNRTHRLEVEALKAEGGVLHAPYEHQMIARVAETMTSGIDLRLSRLADGAPVYEGHGRHACFEAQGDLGSLLDGP